jgi:hypothetical protein
MKAARMFVVLIAFSFAQVALASVSVDYDKTVDFSSLRTYAWLEGTPARSPLVQKRIVSAVEKELQARGLTRVSGKADLLIATHASARGEKRVDVDNLGYGYSWRGWETTTVNVREVLVGTLLVDLVDGTSNDLVWRAVATETFTGNLTPEKLDKRINKVVHKIFKKYPVKAGK